eukprot:131178-Rhodomonas_salina.4
MCIPAEAVLACALAVLTTCIPVPGDARRLGVREPPLGCKTPREGTHPPPRNRIQGTAFSVENVVPGMRFLVSEFAMEIPSPYAMSNAPLHHPVDTDPSSAVALKYKIRTDEWTKDDFNLIRNMQTGTENAYKGLKTHTMLGTGVLLCDAVVPDRPCRRLQARLSFLHLIACPAHRTAASVAVRDVTSAVSLYIRYVLSYLALVPGVQTCVLPYRDTMFDTKLCYAANRCNGYEPDPYRLQADRDLLPHPHDHRMAPRCTVL